MNLVLLLAACAIKLIGSFRLVDSLEVYAVFMNTNLIKPHMGKLIRSHLVGNNYPEFRNRRLDCYFFKLTLGSDYFVFCFWTATFKTILTQ